MKESRAYKTGVPVAVASVDQGGMRTILGVPLINDGAVVGVLNVSRQTVRPFTDQQIALVQAFAAQAQIAMKNARLMNETREALERQTATAEVLRVISSSVADTAPVFQKIIQSCETLFNCDYANVVLLGDDGLMHLIQDTADESNDAFAPFKTMLRSQFPRPPRESIHGYAIHKRQVLHYPDQLNGADVPAGLREFTRLSGGNASAVYVPMFWEGKGIGTLAVHRFPPRPFSGNEISLLKTFADQAVIAIQNARLFNETQEALARQTATADMLQVISDSPTDVQPVFDAIVERGAAVRRRAATSSAVDGEWRHLLACTATARRAADLARCLAAAAGGPARPTSRRARFAARPWCTWPTGRRSSCRAHEQLRARSARRLNSALIVPMLRGGEIFGVLVLAREHARPSADKEIALAETFADQARDSDREHAAVQRDEGGAGAADGVRPKC